MPQLATPCQKTGGQGVALLYSELQPQSKFWLKMFYCSIDFMIMGFTAENPLDFD